MAAIIEVENLSKLYGRQAMPACMRSIRDPTRSLVALWDLPVRQTTLLNIISTIDKPTQGR